MASLKIARMAFECRRRAPLTSFMRTPFKPGYPPWRRVCAAAPRQRSAGLRDATNASCRGLLEVAGEFRAGHHAVEVAEAARLADLARGVDQARHGSAIQRRGEADAAHAGRRELSHGERLARNADHEVYGLGNRC